MKRMPTKVVYHPAGNQLFLHVDSEYKFGAVWHRIEWDVNEYGVTHQTLVMDGSDPECWDEYIEIGEF
jgi:hypothetical protein